MKAGRASVSGQVAMGCLTRAGGSACDSVPLPRRAFKGETSSGFGPRACASPAYRLDGLAVAKERPAGV